MNIKIIIAAVVLVGAIIFASVSFVESNVEYGDFRTAIESNKKIQVKGEWVKARESSFDASTSSFTFYMKDDSGEEVKVVLEGAKPNNFEIATSIVAKGRYKDGCFHASEVLTKCPSKYEGTSETMKKTL
jgi:cytochrome c-type biogenesis protein CcmE